MSITKGRIQELLSKAIKDRDFLYTLQCDYRDRQRLDEEVDLLTLAKKGLAAEGLEKALSDMVDDTLQLDGACPRETWELGRDALNTYREAIK